jgi:hypothetical protein
MYKHKQHRSAIQITAFKKWKCGLMQMREDAKCAASSTRSAILLDRSLLFQLILDADAALFQ